MVILKMLNVGLKIIYNNMKKITIAAPKGKIINKELFDKTGKIEFIDEQYPKSIENIKNRDWYINNEGNISNCNASDANNLSSKKRAETFLALIQLVELRDAWNKIDGEIEFQHNKPNYTIYVFRNNITKTMYLNVRKILHFRKKETRCKFLIQFKDLIEQAKELL